MKLIAAILVPEKLAAFTEAGQQFLVNPVKTAIAEYADNVAAQGMF